MERNLTEGSIAKNLLVFSLPYLLSCFLQTFYGMADLFITGQFNGASTISAVSIGSQIMHMLTVVIVGLTMGSTVLISRSVGAKEKKDVSKTIGNATILFLVFSLASTVLLILAKNGIIYALDTPEEAVREAGKYMVVCFIGVPFITAYNVICSIFRGLGDTKSPMIFVFIAGVINIGLDYLLIGPMGMGAAGAAIATVISQAISVLISLIALMGKKEYVTFTRDDFRPTRERITAILRIGLPVAFQDGIIQISFLVITAIANSRGVEVAAAVGIVEKYITFVFLVPSAMLASVSALAAQNLGAGKPDRSLQTLKYALGFCIVYGLICIAVTEALAPQIVGAFVKNEPQVQTLGVQYLRSYIVDVMFGGIQFSFSGYFCAFQKSIYSFIHNIISVLTVRIPGTYLASRLFPATLLPMGMAAPAGSLLSSLICIGLFLYRKQLFTTGKEK